MRFTYFDLSRNIDIFDGGSHFSASLSQPVFLCPIDTNLKSVLLCKSSYALISKNTGGLGNEICCYRVAWRPASTLSSSFLLPIKMT